MPFIAARLGDHVDDTAERPSVFGPEAVIDDAELLHRFLRGRGALHAGIGVDEVRAVHGDHIAEGAHAAEGNLCYFELRDRGPQTGASRGHAWRQEREIGEEPSTDGQRSDLFGLDHLADFRPRGFDERRFACDREGFLQGHLERHIDRCRLAYGQRDTGLDILPEPGGGHCQIVSARRKIWDDVVPNVAGRRGVGQIRIQITKSNGSFDYRGAVCVLHGSIELGEAGSGLRKRLVYATEENRNNDGREQTRTSFHNSPLSAFYLRTSKKHFSIQKNMAERMI